MTENNNNNNKESKKIKNVHSSVHNLTVFKNIAIFLIFFVNCEKQPLTKENLSLTRLIKLGSLTINGNFFLNTKITINATDVPLFLPYKNNDCLKVFWFNSCN